jgi:hypothetical protein
MKRIFSAIWARLCAVQWNRHTFALLLGAAVAFVPDLTDLAKEATETGWRPLLIVARVIGYALTAIAVASKAYVRISPILDRIEALEPVVKPGDDAVTKPETPSAKDKGFTLIPFLLFFAAITASLAITFPAHGQALDASTGLPKVMLEDPIPTPQLGVKWGRWTTQPATAAGFQVNLKTGDYERIAIMVGYGATYHGRQVTIGAVAFAGVGLSANAPNAPQASLLLTLWDSVAIGPGVTIFKGSGGDRIFQGLLTFAFNMTTGATTEGLKGFMDVARVCAM